ncbi:phosphopantothenoylcysteine decarboxylase isoform X2 [Sebastes fasciatus]|uniref:phosphopantothenoylcysteine decarboxylase isoform X2 n=1 Tax=Sebastes fasciatus TaxID=394691 RepID=UPI003D9E118A
MQTDEHVFDVKSDLLTSCGTFRVLVGVTGSVAALKLPLLVTQLLQLPGVDVRVVTTEHAKHFYNPAEVSVKIYSDKDEWELWTQRTDPVLHIDLRRWADLLVIAPLDANTLGKIANGICDNLVTLSLPDMCGKSLGYQSPPPLLPCNEYSYVAASHYSPAGITAHRVWICGNPLHC